MADSVNRTKNTDEKREWFPAYRCVTFAKGLSDKAKVLYSALVSYDWDHVNNEIGDVWPRQRTLQELLGWKERLLRDKFIELKNYGLISIRLEGLPAHNVYRFLPLHNCDGHCNGLEPGELASLTDRHGSADLITKGKISENTSETASLTDRQIYADQERHPRTDHNENHLKEKNHHQRNADDDDSASLLPEPSPPSGKNGKAATDDSIELPAFVERLDSLLRTKKESLALEEKEKVALAWELKANPLDEPYQQFVLTVFDQARLGLLRGSDGITVLSFIKDYSENVVEAVLEKGIVKNANKNWPMYLKTALDKEQERREQERIEKEKLEARRKFIEPVEKLGPHLIEIYLSFPAPP
ncbi:MAG: hypothetical protein AAB864_01720, partial [Patescibacteria group bacterium]